MGLKTWLFLSFSLIAGFLFLSCSQDGKIVSVTKKENVGLSSQLSTNQIRRGSDVITKPIDGTPPNKRFIVAFPGYLSTSEQKIYTISSRAELGTPLPLESNSTRFLEITPSSDPNLLFVLVEENGKKSIGQLNTKTNFLYILLSNIGNVSDLKSSGAKLGFLERKPNNTQSLNIFFVNEQEVRKKELNQNENITYQFGPKGSFLIYTKIENNQSSFFKMSLEKENFGESVLLLTKEGVTLSQMMLHNNENKICFVEKSASSKLKFLDLTTQEEVFIFESENIYEPAISPNEEFLTFWSESREGQKLWLYEFLSKNLEAIAPLSVPSKTESYYRKSRVHPVWTPDGREIVFSNFNRWYGQILKYDLLTKKTTTLTDNIFVDFYNPIILGEEKL